MGKVGICDANKQTVLDNKCFIQRLLILELVLACDAQAKLALIVAQCLSIHLSICPSVCLSATAWVTRMYAALCIASHVDYRLVNTINDSPEVPYDTHYDSSCHYCVLSNVSLHWQWL